MDQETLTPQDLQAFRGIPDMLRRIDEDLHELRKETKSELFEIKTDVEDMKSVRGSANGKSASRPFDAAEFDLYLTTAQIIGAFWATPELRKGWSQLLYAGPAMIGAAADINNKKFDLRSRRFLIPALTSAGAWFALRPKA
jgi:hypothetical protein